MFTIKRSSALAQALLVLLALLWLGGCGGPQLSPWHTVQLTSEFSADSSTGVDSFEDYLQLEDTVFGQLDELLYDNSDTGPQYALERYSRGSLADPEQRQGNWNRSFELDSEAAVGGVLLLHGMSDSPYSLRAIGEALQQRGFQVLGLRMPGHGTAPSGLVEVSWQDMSAVVRLGMTHLSQRVGDKPIHIIGYSTGAALALDFALQAEQSRAEQSRAGHGQARAGQPGVDLARHWSQPGGSPGQMGPAFIAITRAGQARLAGHCT